MDRRTFLTLPAITLFGPLKRVWVLGDSNAFLLMRHMRAIARRCGVKLDGNAVGGTSIMWWAKRPELFGPMRAFHPDLVLVILGTNDAHYQPHVFRGLKPHLSRLSALLDRATGPSLWVGPPQMPTPRTRAQAETLRKMVLAQGFDLLDSRRCRMPVWSDGIHPSEVGQPMWAEWIWRHIP